MTTSPPKRHFSVETICRPRDIRWPNATRPMVAATLDAITARQELINARLADKESEHALAGLKRQNERQIAKTATAADYTGPCDPISAIKASPHADRLRDPGFILALYRTLLDRLISGPGTGFWWSGSEKRLADDLKAVSGIPRWRLFHRLGLTERFGPPEPGIVALLAELGWTTDGSRWGWVEPIIKVVGEDREFDQALLESMKADIDAHDEEAFLAEYAEQAMVGATEREGFWAGIIDRMEEALDT